MLQNTRDLIISAGLEIILKEGIQGISFTKLAKVSGISRQNIYLYFNSTEEIISQCRTLITQDFSNYLYSNISPDWFSLEKVKYIARRFVAYSQNKPHYFDYLINQSQDSLMTVNFIFQHLIQEVVPRRKKGLDQELFIHLFSFIYGYTTLIRHGQIVYQSKYFEAIVEKIWKNH